MPDRELIAVVPHGASAGPPDLMVGGGDDLPEVRSGDGAADRDVRMRSEPALRFDGDEVLDVVAEVAAQILDEPVQQRGEVDGIPHCPPVVIAGRINGRAILADRAVAVAGEGEEHRRPVRLAVWGG